MRTTATWPVHIVPTFLGLLVLAGIALLVAKRESLISTYLLLSLLALCATPWPQQFGRYLTPMCAFLALALFMALQAVLEWSRRAGSVRLQRVGRAFAVGAVTILALTNAFVFRFTYATQHPQVTYHDRAGRQIAYPLFFYTDAQRVLDQALDWLLLHSRSGDVVACSMPSWAYMRTGLKSVMPPFEPDPAKAAQLLDSVPVRYLIIDDGLAVDTRGYMIPVAKHAPENWRLVYSASIVKDGTELKDRFQIYERIPSASVSAAPSGSQTR